MVCACTNQRSCTGLNVVQVPAVEDAPYFLSVYSGHQASFKNEKPYTFLERLSVDLGSEKVIVSFISTALFCTCRRVSK